MAHPETACRSCGHPLSHTFVDLGMSPISNDNLRADQLMQMEPFYPLHAFVCDRCWLVQLPEVKRREEIFTSDYAYFASFSDSWLEHCRRYVEAVVPRFGLGAKSHVTEIASNDGYLLQYFVAKKIPVLGIEPSANVAEAAVKKGIPTRVEFFGTAYAKKLAAEGIRSDLVIGNNVLAHVPGLNDFVGGLKVLLKPDGVVTMEFPHLMRLVEGNQFDTIYHEHFSYFSLIAVQAVFARHGLAVFDVDELPTHGGSLRLYARHEGDASKPVTAKVRDLLARERAGGMDGLGYYRSFGEKVRETKRRLLDFLLAAKRQGKQVVGYGAPAKGNTLLNYCGIRADFLDYTVDRSPQKQGRFLPGTHIPIFAPDKFRETRPDYVLILPWNIRDEIVEQMKHIREWGGKFVVPIPEVKVLG